jgi:general secretion pathway protein K
MTTQETNSSPAGAPGAQPARPVRSRRGVALVMVLIAIALTLVITNEFGTSTSTDIIAASNYRDEVRAHFLARSAQNLGELVIRIQQRLDNVKMLSGQVQITDFADQLVLPFCGSDAEVKDAIGFTTDQIKGLGADIGTCGFEGPLETEDSKLNVNCANVDTAWQAIASALSALIYFPAYDTVFDENDARGWHRDRDQQVAAIIDYIDQNVMHLRNLGTTEDYAYEALKDPYYAKNTYIDTVGELKLVRGVDDRFWTLFGGALTAYGGCKLNISAVTNPQLIAALLYLSAKNPQDPVILSPQRLFTLATYVAKAKQFGEVFMTLNDFITYVADPMASIGTLASQTGTIAGSAAGAAVAQGIVATGEKIGMQLDAAKLGQIATSGPRRTYKVKAYGEIARMQKNADGSPVFPAIRSTITGVWDTKVVPQNVRKPPVPNGAWVFLQEQE